MYNKYAITTHIVTILIHVREILTKELIFILLFKLNYNEKYYLQITCKSYVIKCFHVQTHTFRVSLAVLFIWEQKIAAKSCENTTNAVLNYICTLIKHLSINTQYHVYFNFVDQLVKQFNSSITQPTPRSLRYPPALTFKYTLVLFDCKRSPFSLKFLGEKNAKKRRRPFYFVARDLAYHARTLTAAHFCCLLLCVLPRGFSS